MTTDGSLTRQLDDTKRNGVDRIVRLVLHTG
jgi:hypothetical protein